MRLAPFALAAIITVAAGIAHAQTLTSFTPTAVPDRRGAYDITFTVDNTTIAMTPPICGVTVTVTKPPNPRLTTFQAPSGWSFLRDKIRSGTVHWQIVNSQTGCVDAGMTKSGFGFRLYGSPPIDVNYTLLGAGGTVLFTIQDTNLAKVP